MKFNTEQEVIDYLKETESKEERVRRIKNLSSQQRILLLEIRLAVIDCIRDNECLDTINVNFKNKKEVTFEYIYESIIDELKDYESYDDFELFTNAVIKYQAERMGYNL